MQPSNTTSMPNELISQIKRWTTSPVFPNDEDKTRRARMLNLALINVLVLLPVLSIGFLIGGKTPMQVFEVNALDFALCMVLYRWMHQGRVRLASVGLMALGLFGITASIAGLGTIRAPSTAMYLLMVITAGLLFDLSGMIIIIALCSVLVAGLIMAGNMGLLPSPDYALTITQWISYTTILGWAGSLTYSALQSMNHALAQAKNELAERKLAEAELSKHRDHLEELIKERTAELQDANDELGVIARELRQQNSELMRTQSALQMSEGRYHALFNSMTEGFALHEIICDDQGLPIDYRFLDINPAFVQLTGLKRENVIGRTQRESLPDEDPQWVRKYGAVALSGEPARFENYSPALKRHYEVFAYRPALRQFAVLFTDITERKNAEEKLKASESRYRNLYESMMDAFVYVDRDGRIIEFNEVYRQMLGYEPDELRKLTYIDITPEKWHAFEAEIIQNQAYVRGYTDIYEKEYRRKDGTILPIELRACLARDEQGNPNGLWGIVRDITNRKRAEEDLAKHNALLRSIIESPRNIISFSLDQGYHYISFNELHRQTMKSIWGVDISMGMNMMDVIGYPDDREKARANFDRALSGENFTVAEQYGDDALRRGYWDSIYSPIMDDQGEIIGVTVFCIDVTEQKLAEEKIIVSLQEKEVLLKEIHHRVKNNMQIIHSLLSIQANSIQDKSAKMAIAECKDRVRSMALIHESLYRSENLAKVDFAGYIRSLTKSLFYSFGIDRRRIKLSLDMEPVLLSIDKAIPCGLIVNELVSNCLKHAFPGQRSGEVQVELRSLDDSRISLVIRDNGIGLMESLEPHKAKTLGLRLVTDLVRQLKGDIHIDHNGGTEFKIVFPAEI